MLNKQIAHKLGIPEKTAKVRRVLIMGKLLVESVAKLIRLEMVFSSDC
jgi:FixJ family two-component response regulator